MTKQTVSVVKDGIRDESKGAIQHFIKHSYTQAKKQLDAGVHSVHNGVNFIRDEITEMYDMTGYYLDKMVLPINNFLKDFSQIDTEFSQESAHFMTLDGKRIPVEQVLSQKMEENY